MTTFKEISIGGVNKEQLLHQLTDAGIQYNQYAQLLFKHPSFLPCDKTKKAKLIKVSLADLNLNNPCSFDEIVSRAALLNLKLCPLYSAAFLRLQYLEQPQGPYLTIASAIPKGSEEYPTGFYIRNYEHKLWLRGYRAEGSCDWPADNEFIFLN